MSKSFCGQCGTEKAKNTPCKTCKENVCDNCKTPVDPANRFCAGCGVSYRAALKRKASAEAEQDEQDEEERRRERLAAQFTQDQLMAIKGRKYVQLKHFQEIQPWDELDEKVFAIEDNSRIVTKQAGHKQPSIETEDAFWSALFRLFMIETYLIPTTAQSNMEALSLFKSWKTHWKYTMNYIERVRHKRSGRITSLATIDHTVFFSEIALPTSSSTAQPPPEQGFTVAKACIQRHLCIAFNTGGCDEDDNHKLPSGKRVRHRCAKCFSNEHPITDCDKITFEELRFNPNH